MKSFCDCSGYFGFTGAECATRSSFTKYQLFSATASLLVAAIGIMFSIFILRLFFYVKAFYANTAVFPQNHLWQATLAILGSFLFFSASKASDLAVLVDYSTAQIVQRNALLGKDVQQISGPLGALSIYSLILGLYLCAMAGVIIILSWFSFLSRIRLALKPQDIRRIKIFKICTLLVVSLLSVLLVLFACLDLLNPVSYVGASFSILVFTITVTARRLFLRSVAKLRSQTTALTVANTIRSFSFALTLAFALFILLLMVIGTNYMKFEESVLPGSVHPGVILFEASFAIQSFVLFRILSFIYKLLINLSRNRPARRQSSPQQIIEL